MNSLKRYSATARETCRGSGLYLLEFRPGGRKAVLLIEQGLEAFQAEQYVEALHYFQQALSGIRSTSERDRVLMWIARCSLVAGQPEVHLQTCSQLLGSPDAQVRSFARAGLLQGGLIHRETSALIDAKLGRLLVAALRVYFDQFWSLLSSSLLAGLWTIGLSIAAICWLTFALHFQIETKADTPLRVARALWWWLLVLVPVGTCALLALDRILAAIDQQRRTLLLALGAATVRGGHPWLVRLGGLACSLVVLAALVLLVQVHWWAAALLSLGLQPGLVSLWLVIDLAVQPTVAAVES